MGPFEIIHIDSKKTSCDGGRSSSRHPLVYLNMGEKDYVICPYCNRYFTTHKISDNIDFLREFHKETHREIHKKDSK